MSRRKLVEVSADRWIIRARDATVTGFQADVGRRLLLEFDTGLTLQVTGEWRATMGSPRTGSNVDLGSGRSLLGTKVLSLVLFDSGAVRLVLSNGLTITARPGTAARISSTLPGEYDWTSDAEGVTRHIAGLQG